MTEVGIEEITDKLLKHSLSTNGVSFKGKSLVLNTEKECDEVVEAINVCKNLEYLNLEGNTLGVEASKAISKALESKSELKRALWMDMFTGRMKEEIPRALEYLSSGLTVAGAQLTELDLSDNAFGPIGVKGLAGLISSQACYQLQVLKLNNNGLGSSGGKMLADALLQCHKNSSKEGKTFALRFFVAGRNRLENEGAIELAKVFDTLGTLEEICMPQNGIYHKGIKALSDSLKNNFNLRVLDLNDNTITKKGAKHIANVLPHLQQLKVLNLGDCLLRTSGATVLANALADRHEHLEELHLTCNEIKSDGGLALVKAMANKSNLKQLNVNGNLFGTKGRKLLKEGLKKNKRIDTLDDLNDDCSCDEYYDSDEGSSDDNCKDESDEESCDDKSEEENYEDKSEEENYEDNGEEENCEDIGEEENCEDRSEDENSEDRSEDENYEDKSEEENCEDKSEEENEEEEKKPNGVASHIENISNLVQYESYGKSNTSDALSQLLSNLAIKANIVGPLKTFLENPVIENFLSVPEKNIYEIILNNQDYSDEFYIDTFIPMLVKISSLSSCENPDVVKSISEVSSLMYKNLFTWASDENKLCIVNNALFVHLGLIKSEDKGFKVNWDTKGSLSALMTATTNGSVPPTTQNILKCLLEKKEKEFPEEITIG